MGKYQTNTTVKLKGEYHAPDTEIEVSGDEEKDLLAKNAIREAGEPRPAPQPAVTRMAETDEEDAPAKKASKSRKAKAK